MEGDYESAAPFFMEAGHDQIMTTMGSDIGHGEVGWTTPCVGSPCTEPTRVGILDGAAESIHVVGADYRHTILSVRERLAGDAPSATALLRRMQSEFRAGGCVLLRTCNRCEVYFVGPRVPRDERVVAGALFQEEPFRDGVNAENAYHYVGLAAARHLFRVACGLESMVLGEHEILGQVKAALAEAGAVGRAGPVLTRLFHHGVRAGKRARRETAISSGIFSVGQCAVRLARRVLGDLTDRRVLLIGAGRVGGAAAKHMVASGARSISVLSRTRVRAEALASFVGGRAVGSEQLPEVVRESDVVLGCAAAPRYAVTMAQMELALMQREPRPLVVVDLGVPRNFDPHIGVLPNVHLSNIDEMETVVEESVRVRAAAVREAEAIVEEELAELERRELKMRLRAAGREARTPSALPAGVLEGAAPDATA